MKNKLLAIIVSVLLVVTLTVTTVLAVSCNGKKDPDSSGAVVVPEPEPQPDPDTPEDRSPYAFENFTAKAYDVKAKALLYVDGTDANKIDGLEGFLLGDLYNDALEKVLNIASASLKESGLNINITADLLNAKLFRGVDGNWYRVLLRENTNTRVNSCLNNILNYKLDGSEKLNIDYTLYGNKTLAYILFDYTEASSDPTDPNWMLGMALAVSPLMNGIFKTTLNELRTLIKGDDAARVEIILKNFGDVKLKEFASMFLTSDLRKNDFVKATIGMTVKQAYDILTASDDSEKYGQLATIYKGISVANVFNVSETDKFYIEAIHAMTLEGLFTAMQGGRDATVEYLLKRTGNLKVGEVVKAVIALYFNDIEDETEKAEKIDAAYEAYDKVYQNFKPLFDLTVNDIYGAVSGLPNYETVKATVIIGNFTLGSLIDAVKSGVVISPSAGKLFDVAKVVDYLLDNYAEELDGVNLGDGVTLKTIVVTMQKSFVDNEETEFKTFSLDAFFTALESEFTKEQLDAAAKYLLTNDYQTLKGKVESVVDYYENLFDMIMSSVKPSETQNVYATVVKVLNAVIAYNEEDVMIYSFTDSKGNVFDITLNEVLKVLKEILKQKQGADYDLKGEIANLLGDATIGTFIELIDSLQISASEPIESAA